MLSFADGLDSRDRPLAVFRERVLARPWTSVSGFVVIRLAPSGGKFAQEVKSEDREIEEAEIHSEEERQPGPLEFHLRPKQGVCQRR